MEPFGWMTYGSPPVRGIIFVVHGGVFSGGCASHNQPLAEALANTFQFDVCRLDVSSKTPEGYKQAITAATIAARSLYRSTYVWGVSSGGFFACWSLCLDEVDGVVGHCPVLDPRARAALVPSVREAQLKCFGSELVLAEECRVLRDIFNESLDQKPRVLLVSTAPDKRDTKSPIAAFQAFLDNPLAREVEGGAALSSGEEGHKLCTQWTEQELRQCIDFLLATPV
jgi:hypothetical protein